MKKNLGFTLVELMIVVAIIGLLSIVSLPMIKNYTARTERVDECKKPLYEIALEQAKYRELNGTYTTNIADLNYPATSSGGKYTYTLEDGTTNSIASSFLVTCEKDATKNIDVDCGNLTLDNFGREGVDGGTKSAEACWR